LTFCRFVDRPIFDSSVHRRSVKTFPDSAEQWVLDSTGPILSSLGELRLGSVRIDVRIARDCVFYCMNDLLFPDHSDPGAIAINPQPLSTVACETPWRSSHIQAYRANPDSSLQARHRRSPWRTIRETQSSEPLSPRQLPAGIRH